MLAVRGSSRRGTLQNTTTEQEAAAPDVFKCTTTVTRGEKAEKHGGARNDPQVSQVSQSAPVPKHVGRAELMSRDADDISQAFATIHREPSPRPSLRRVKGVACLRDHYSNDALKPVENRASESMSRATSIRSSKHLSFRERMKAINDGDSGIYIPNSPDNFIENDQQEHRTKSPRRSTSHLLATHPSAAEHPCRNLITLDMLSQILHYHTTREMLRATLSRMGNENLVDSWLKLKAQKAAQAYADTALNELQEIPNEALSSDRPNKSNRLEGSLLDRLLNRGLPELLTEIVAAWLQSIPIRNALELRAADMESIAHSDSLFTDGRNIRKTIPNLLRSFCISDPKIEGNPINVTSKDLKPRESIREDELMYLKLPKNVEEYSTITAAYDEHGAPIYSLIISTPLLDSFGKIGNTLTSQVNISYFIQQHVSRTLSSQNTDEINEKAGLDLAIRDGTSKYHGSLEMLTTAIHLDNAYRRGSSVQPQQVRPINPSTTEAAARPVSFVDWMGIAHEESLKSRADPAEVHRSFRKLEDCTDLPELIKQVKFLYKDHFVMASSKSADLFEVTCISPSLHSSGTYAHNPFQYTAHSTFRWIVYEMRKKQDFAVKIKWGETRADKWLYCTPMLGPKMVCWVCILLDGDVINVWEE